MNDYVKEGSVKVYQFNKDLIQAGCAICIHDNMGGMDTCYVVNRFDTDNKMNDVMIVFDCTGNEVNYHANDFVVEEGKMISHYSIENIMNATHTG